MSGYYRNCNSGLEVRIIFYVHIYQYPKIIHSSLCAYRYFQWHIRTMNCTGIILCNFYCERQINDFYQCWARTTFFSSRHRDMHHLLNLCAVFWLNFSRHRISATVAPRYSILAPPRHILGTKIRAIKKSVTEPYFSKIVAKNILLHVPMYHVPIYT